MTGYIYKIINDVNDKLYIGLCTTSIEERFLTHKADSKKRSHEMRPLYRAMNKYGIEHFSIEMIEECDIDVLGEREQYWIAYYDTYHNGYNATLGGDGTPYFDHSLILNRLQEYPYPIEIAKEIGCSSDLVRAIAKRNNITVKNLQQDLFQSNRKTISALDKKTGILIQSFASTTDAAKWCFANGYCATLNSGVRSHIAAVANGQRQSAYGFKWIYSNE